MFDTLSDRLSATFKNLRGKGRLSEADIDATAREIRIALLEADVALPVVRAFIANVKERARGVEVSQALNPAQQVVKIVNEELVAILGGETRRLRFAKTAPTVIMLAGLQGAGKTTLAGKLGLWLKGQGHSPLLVACDLQRPNAVNQLSVVAERAGVAVYAPEPGNGVGDPVQVAKDSIEFAKAKVHDIVIVDTAGRLGIDQELMQQAADIRDAVSPDEILFVVDAMIGQDAVNTAEAFRDGVGFDGVVLSKLDGDARGGAALSIAHVTGKQVMFASNGEKLEDFDAFHPDRMASRILDMGDLLTLIEQAEKTFSQEEAAKMASKLQSSKGGKDFTLDDFLAQMEQVRKMGSISKLLGMLPGMGQIKDQINNIDERDIDRTAAIIKSMTPKERAEPTIINGSRRARIAKGSGVEVSAVKSLVERFFEARKMMSKMAQGGGMPGMPGMPGMGGGPGRQKKQVKQAKGKRKSGNPMKRKAEEQAAAARREQAAAQGGAFGLPAQDGGKDFELPDEFKKFM
ncbi:signal recognition particle protein [Streptomyces filamentosus]|uniref:Signal recognition particle protein n=4 Tax=Streptomyces TaxID=1883 RepID=A0ABY4UUL5_STRFL|nr:MULTISPECIES: signal recognition particle protein [Streptomyces]MYR81829.1 signal recognition particle protein [Streptomyces sp. SID5466]MYV63881.1 signal recognition particle protein [Streptomyces sp. SID4931]SCG09270.1 signal recognition particle subunit FFH/SRP54 (srp54) [Streptomyces sp. Ncost-T6T-2b]EFE77928.1 signal recognition particle protein [Streptomyces filamentosus NRRL 15998]ESU49341.1 signal recognition particle protein [Streptomyces sp. HCCB10043]